MDQENFDFDGSNIVPSKMPSSEIEQAFKVKANRVQILSNERLNDREESKEEAKSYIIFDHPDQPPVDRHVGSRVNPALPSLQSSSDSEKENVNSGSSLETGTYSF